jgi:Tol biopolymer transport system component
MRALAGVAAAMLAALVAIAAPGAAAVLPVRTLLASSAPGASANGPSANPALARGGRFVLFDSAATNLGPADGNGATRDVYQRDVLADTVTLVSAASDGTPADAASSDPAADPDLRTVAYVSAATNLVAGDGNGASDIFVRTAAGLARASVSSSGQEGNGPSRQPDVSADGSLVAFTSSADNLVRGDRNARDDVFVRDLRTGRTERVSVSSSEREGDGIATTPAISADGRFVSFSSTADNLVRGDRNRAQDVFLRDRRTGRTERVSVSTSGGEQNRSVIPPFAQVSAVSDRGRYVVFDSDANSLVRGDRNRDTDVFVRDRARRRTFRVSLGRGGREGDNDSFNPSMTPDGRFVVFQSFAGNLAPGGSRTEDIFVRDLARVATATVNVAPNGRPAAPRTGRQLLQRPAISGDGAVVAFTSRAGNLAAGDGNALADVFLRDLTP